MKRDLSVELKGENLNVEQLPPLLKSGAKPTGDSQVSVVEFEAVEFLAYDTDREIRLTLIRRGNVSNALTVIWRNENISTKKEHFIQQDGSASFSPGQTVTSFTLRLNPIPEWMIEAQQRVTLVLPKLQGDAILGDAYQAMVFVLNYESFPNGLTDEEEPLKLTALWNMVVHLYHELKPLAIRGLSYKLYPGISFIFSQSILLFFINYSLDPIFLTTQTDRLLWLLVLAALYLGNTALNNFCSLMFIRLRVGGKAYGHLRSSIVETALQFTSTEQDRFPSTRIANALDADVTNVVEFVWKNAFDIASAVFVMACNLAYAWGVNISGLAINGYWFTLLLCSIPILIGVINAVVLYLSYDEMATLAYKVSLGLDQLNENSDKALALRTVINDYGKSHKSMKRYRHLHQLYGLASTQTQLHRSYRQWLSKWCANVLTAAMIITVGFLVIVEGYPVGNFVTLFNAMVSYSSILSEVFDLVATFFEGYASVTKIRAILNAETRRKEALKLSARSAKESGLTPMTLPAGMRPIGEDELRVQDVSYKFSDDKDSESFKLLSFGVESGQVVAIKGSGSVGKRTLLSLIAKQLVPDKGFIHYPSSWRVSYISSVPAVFDGTLMENLRFGEYFEHTDEEVWELCNYFGFAPALIGKGDFMVGSNGCRLSYTDGIMVSFIRAMLSSPDLILLPSTFDALGEGLVNKVIAGLKQYVEDREFSCLTSDNTKRSAAPVDRLLLKNKLVLISTRLQYIEQQVDTAIVIKENGE